MKVLLERVWSFEVTTNVLEFLPKVHMTSAFNAMMELAYRLSKHDPDRDEYYFSKAQDFVKSTEYYELTNSPILSIREMNKACDIFQLVAEVGIGSKNVTMLQLRSPSIS